MEKAVQTMIDNIEAKTGKTLDQWKADIAAQGLQKHGEIVKYLKETHGITHGYASEIGLKILKSDADSSDNTNELLEAQYKGKEDLKAIYNKLIEEIGKFDGEFEIAPKKAYVALRRKKQFIIINPATKTRVEIGFNLKGTEAQGRLLAEKPDGICSHKISITALSEIDAEVINWIKLAYEKSI